MHLRFLSALALAVTLLAAGHADANPHRARGGRSGVPTPPGTLSLNVGAKDRAGYGGISYADLACGATAGTATITSETNGLGATVSTYGFDVENNIATLKNDAGTTLTYGGANPGLNGPYHLVVNCAGSPITLTLNVVANTAYIKPLATARADQLTNMINKASAFDASGLVLGDTIVGRDGIWNPTAADFRLRPPAGFYSAGSGPRITLISEHPNTSLDASGNPVGGGGFQTPGGMNWDGAVSGGGIIPIDIRYVTFYYDDVVAGRNLLGYASGLSGLHVYNSRFEIGPDTPANVINQFGMVWAGDEVFDHNHCIRVIKCASGGPSADGHTQTITWNICETMGSDCFTIVGAGWTITDNFARSWYPFPGNHPDFIQHQGFSDGVDHPNDAILLRNIGVRDNLYPLTSTATCTTHLASVTVDGCSIDIVAQKWRLYSTISGAGIPNAGAIGNYINAINSTTSFDLKAAATASATVTLTAVQEDSQGIFMQGKTGLASASNGVAKNNILMLGAANGLSTYQWVAPVINFNDVISDLVPGELTMAINANSQGCTTCLGGNFNNNTTTGLSIAGQLGSPTNTNTTILARTLAAYQGVWAGWTNTGLVNRAAVITAFTPKRTAVKGDGTFATSLFPANDFGETCWNDGSVWNSAAHCTQAQ